MENMGVKKIVAELRRLNPTINWIGVDVRGFPEIIYPMCDDCTKFNLPEGYYYNEKQQELTNKHNTTSGSYESFMLMTYKEYSETFLQTEIHF